MNLSIEPTMLIGFCLAFARATAWVVVSPPFNTQAIPVRVRIGFAVALSFVVARHLAPSDPTIDTAGLIGSLLMQVLAGVALGVLVMFLFSAIQAAGELIDLQVGFSLGGVLDPLSGNMAAPFGRFHQLIGLAILFAIDGHVLIVRGFLRSIEAAPAGGIELEELAEQAIRFVGIMFAAAIEISLPILAALFATEVALGLLGKAAPQLNILMLGFGVKTMVAFALLGTTLLMLPETTSSLLTRSLRGGLGIFGG